MSSARAAGASGFPAHAGMDLLVLVVPNAARHGFPAHAGMDRRELGDLDAAGKVSPPTRGWTIRA